MRAIKIDVVKRQVYEVDVKPGIEEIYKQLECDCFDTVPITPRKEILYVDDNGLLIDKKLGAFSIGTYPYILSGHGLILGLSGPDSVATKLSLGVVRSLVKWRDVSELPEPKIEVLPLLKRKIK